MRTARPSNTGRAKRAPAGVVCQHARMPEEIDGPHDVLAAEEFAVPGPGPHALPPDYVPPRRSPSAARRLAAIVAGLLALLVLTRRRGG